MQSSSTSSSSRAWRFLRIWLATLLLGCAAYFAVYLLIDPFGTNSRWSLPIARAPLSTDQRYYLPMRARAPEYDSAIIGDSTTLLMDPQRLDPQFGSRFVNLSMNGATAHEALQMYKLFLRHRPLTPRFLIYRLGEYDCLQRQQRYNTAYFPEPLYDDVWWNDGAVAFSSYGLQALWQQMEFALGYREAGYRLDGYLNPYIGPGSNLEAAERRILAEAEEMRHRAEISRLMPQPDRYNFEGLSYLKEMLRITPEQTGKIIVLLPREYRTLLPEDGADARLWAACRAEVAGIIRQTPNALFADLQFDNPLARMPHGWYDGHHFFQPVAEEVMAVLAQAWRTRADIPETARVVMGPFQR